MESAKSLMLDLAVKYHHMQQHDITRHKWRNDKPGQELFRLSNEVQNKLKELKSDDLKDVRLDGLFFFPE